jgi:RNA polymerase sigma-B factor
MYFLAMPLHFKRHLNQRSRDMKLSNKKISLLKGAKARVVTRKLKANKLSKKEQNKIVEDHIALAGFIAKKYLGSREPYEDLVQIGVEGLIKAAARFNKGYGVKFSTYAGPTIEGEIRHYLRDKVSGVKVSRKLLELNGKIRKFVNQFEQTNGYTPQTKQIAKAMKMKETKLVKAIKGAESHRTLSMDMPISQFQGGSMEVTTMEDFLGTESFEEHVIDKEGIRRAMGTLSHREKEVIHLHFFMDEVQENIAKRFNLTQAQISRIISGALGKMEKVLK